MKTQNALTGLLALIAVLLAANLIAFVSSPKATPPAFAPSIQAGEIVNVERPYLVTTSAQGDVLYIWHLGPIVNDRFQEVNVQAFPARR